MTAGSRSMKVILSALLILSVAIVLMVSSVRQLILNMFPKDWQIAISALRHGVLVDHSVRLTMPDGIRIAGSLYLPKAHSKPLPTILIRLPYHRLRYGEGYNSGLFFARNGFAVLVLDLRGTGDSEGELLPWQDAATDGIAALDWITKQSWANGKVGTFGCSALGETQLVLAKEKHPAHLAMIPSGAGGAVGSAANRYSYFGLFEGGVFQLASGFGWFVESGAKSPQARPASAFETAALLKQLPVSGLVQMVRPSPNGYTEFLSTPLGDSRWEQWGYLSSKDQIKVPSLVINTWGDQTVGDALAFAEQQRALSDASAVQQKVVIAPARHCNHEESTSASSFGDLAIKGADQPYKDWYISWFNYWLRGEGQGLAHLPAYTYFMLGENRWHTSTQWPPAESKLVRWHLGSGGRANSRSGNGILSTIQTGTASSDNFSYDPMNPAPSRGGPICCTGNPADRAGPVDQADVEIRDDVLIYTSAPLEQALRIAGPLKTRLTVSSTASDTDLVARLVHVWPDGRSTNIQEGALRLRYREGFSTPHLMEKGQLYEVEIDMRSIAYMIPKGHRMRLHITSSSFPRLERNLNTGGNNADETAAIVANTVVHYQPAGQAYLQLPVLDQAH